MAKKAASKSEKAHMDRVAQIGCIICGGPACLHHPRMGQGLGQRASHWDVIPLCFLHHQGGGYGVAIHAGQKEFERKYGTEAELLAKVRRYLGIDDGEH